MKHIALEVLKGVAIAIAVILFCPAVMLVFFIDLWLIHLMGVS